MSDISLIVNDPQPIVIGVGESFGAGGGTPGVGVPDGGLLGQSLVKASNTDYDTLWKTLGLADIDGLEATIQSLQSGVDGALTQVLANELYLPADYIPSFANIAGVPDFSLVGHGHDISEITGLQGVIDAINSAVSGKSNLGHGHAIGEITGLQGELTSLSNSIDSVLTVANSKLDLSTANGLYALLGHGHSIAQITGLQAALDTKLTQANGDALYKASAYVPAWGEITGVPNFALVGHTHPLSALEQSGATNGQVPVWNGTNWVPGAAGSSLPAGSSAQYLRNDGTSWLASALVKTDIQTALTDGFILTGTGATRMTFDTPTPQTRGVLMKTNGFDVWGFFATVAETFALARYNPATGALLGTVMSVANSTGNMDLNMDLLRLVTGDMQIVSGNLSLLSAQGYVQTNALRIRFGASNLAIQDFLGNTRAQIDNSWVRSMDGNFQGSSTYNSTTSTVLIIDFRNLFHHFRRTSAAVTSLSINSVGGLQVPTDGAVTYIQIANATGADWTGSWLTVPSNFRFPATTNLPNGTARVFTLVYDSVFGIVRCAGITDTTI